MGYQSINNLYKDKKILAFKQVYALEKVHGTSAHIGYKKLEDKLFFYSGGETHERFVALFDSELLLGSFRKLAEEYNSNRICLYGEAYGGRQQGMSHSWQIK